MNHHVLHIGASLIIMMLLMGCHDASQRTRSATPGHSWNAKVDYSQFKRLLEKFYTDAAWAPPGPNWTYFDVVVEWVDGTKEGTANLGESFMDAIGKVNIDIQAKVAVLENEMDKRMSYPDDAFSQAWLRFDAAVRMVYYAIKTPFSADRTVLIEGAKNLLLAVSNVSPSAFNQFTDWYRACKKRRESDESLSETPCYSEAATILEARLILKQLKSLLTRTQEETFKAVSHTILDGLTKTFSTNTQSLHKPYDMHLSALKTLLQPPPQNQRLESLLRDLVRKVSSRNKLNVD